MEKIMTLSNSNFINLSNPQSSNKPAAQSLPTGAFAAVTDRLPGILRVLKLAGLVMAVIMAFSLAQPGLVLAQHSHGGGHDHSAPQPSPAPPATAAVYFTEGIIRELDPGQSRLVVEHGPIEAVGWGPMTMGFLVEDPTLLNGLAVGDKVRLDIKFNSPNDYIVVDLEQLD
ncbi:MAG: copper-binding protein [Deltaproteobacteria bacterium]|nr:copper-binding protein [Deltaproteobacteria bacterium]